MIIDKYYSDFVDFLNKNSIQKKPTNLYEPVNYILQLGGKRIRPLLTLLAADIFSDSYKKALPAALAVEVFHNFTLIHDDIMDAAPLRRGEQTVHKKWDINTGILSGDVMLILASKYFENYPPKVFKPLLQLFNKTAIEVCEGQQLDIDFQTKKNVEIPEYIEMIRLKTSVLVAAALKIGAIIGNAKEEDASKIYNYGLNLGLAFQLQDDLLDTYGNPKTFGKQIGGDIIENKKTFLFLRSLEKAKQEDKETLTQLFSTKQSDTSKKIQKVVSIYNKNEILKETNSKIELYTVKAFEEVDGMKINKNKKELLYAIADYLMHRKN